MCLNFMDSSDQKYDNLPPLTITLMPVQHDFSLCGLHKYQYGFSAAGRPRQCVNKLLRSCLRVEPCTGRSSLPPPAGSILGGWPAWLAGHGADQRGSHRAERTPGGATDGTSTNKRPWTLCADRGQRGQGVLSLKVPGKDLSNGSALDCMTDN